MPGPLAGVRVLDLTRLLPGGYATLLLADLGADVVKIEQPGKGDYIRWSPPLVDGTSAAHVALNRNKRSVTLNLKDPQGRAMLLELAGHFDVLVESFRPGVLDRLGVGWREVHARHPRVVMCSITGYGSTGPRSQEAGHDVNYMSYAGALSIVGEESGRPVIPGFQVGDLAGGAMAGAIAILAALHRRNETGMGDLCDIAMMDGIASWLSIHAASYVATGEVPKRERMPLSGAYPCYRIYPAADGWLSVGALEPQFWQNLCHAIDRRDLIDDAFAVGRRRVEVTNDLSRVFATRTRAEWMTAFAGKDVCVAPVNEFDEAFADEQLVDRGMFVSGEVGGRTWTHVGNPLRFEQATEERLVRRAPPALGEHTAEVLEEIGIDGDRLTALQADGVV